ncbi:esterase family protein [Muricauda sp. CAU 1633]|uniref:alpha/beta hydrolase n=1 Tax=Allomuricauda sp. CAU 1633 TaxID=2816036 RepID=UPI001A8C2E84|nr:alpha/beta hydrolase-fold protein [Muricauda sp. CAU 1633]MBO0323671.1 esterase family protein [Muricauda sp. CAU 1633]
MKLNILIIVVLFMGYSVFAQYPTGTVQVDSLYSKSLENIAGEKPTRSVHIYLPPEYEQTKKKYPVIYYLHGFSGSDSKQINELKLNNLLDKGIAIGKIKPVIVVIPNYHTLYRGSFHTNSPLTGNWIDFTATDLVNYVDENYRTIRKKESRGITGFSMGGYGAVKLAMMFPNTFANVYSFSGCLSLYNELGANGAVYKKLQEIDSREKLIKDYDHFLENAIIAMGQAFSPNKDKPPFYADLPFYYESDNLITDANTIRLWNKQFLHNMADEYVDNLKKLNAIKLDWGRNDQFGFVLLGCRELSRKLEDLGIKHYAEEYIGNHGNKLWTDDGRALNDMLPFFDTNLEFE